VPPSTRVDPSLGAARRLHRGIFRLDTSTVLGVKKFGAVCAGLVVEEVGLQLWEALG